MGACFLYGNGGGGGGGLNFKVVGGTSAPSSPKENTIWVNTDQKITSWHFGADEPNVYNIQPISTDDPYQLIAPYKLSEGDLLSFIIPTTVTGTLEAIRIYDPTTNKAYCVRSWAGASAEAWPVGMKVSLRISNDLWPINGWSMNGSAYITGWGSFYHEEGEVWITTGASSSVAFNALKKNSIQVYPISAKQYIGGAWVDKTAKSYQGGAWEDWVTYLYNKGDECANLTGGWVATATKPSGSGSTATTPTVTKGNNSITVSLTSGSGYYRIGYLATSKSIDLTDYSKITINVTKFSIEAEIIVSNSKTSGFTKAASLDLGVGVSTLDISSLNGKYYVLLGMGGHIGTATFTFDGIYLS